MVIGNIMENKLSPYYSYYMEGISYSKLNPSIAVTYFLKALEYKVTDDVLTALLDCYSKLDNHESYKSCIDKYAQEGFKVAISRSGIFYAFDSKYKDKEKAEYWFNKSIELNDLNGYAGYIKALANETSALGVNLDKVDELLDKALKLNDPRWAGYFNYLYGTRLIDKHDYDKAAIFFELAIKHNYIQAHYNLALLYKDGLGVEKDINQCVDHLTKAGTADAFTMLGGIYILGEYAEVDTHIAYLYFYAAAKLGDPVAAIMAAGILVQKEIYNENYLNQLFEIAFKRGANDQNMKNSYDTIEEAFGEDLRNKLQSLAEKYWDLHISKA